MLTGCVRLFFQGGAREVVAVKCVSKSSLNKASTENLLTEIELLKNLHHDHIVHLKDFQVGFCISNELSTGKEPLAQNR